MANALGSGLVETPALLAYLPAISRELLGEDLKLPWAESWWCGEPVGLGHVLAKLPRMVIKPAFANRRFEPVFADRLDSQQLQDLACRIRCPARRFRGPGADRTVLGSRDAGRAAPVPVRRRPRLPDGAGRQLHGDAGRPDPGRLLGRFQGRHHAERRRQQGYLGPGRPAGRHLQPFAPTAPPPPAQPSGRRSFQPARRQLLLAGPLRRASRERGPPAARNPRPPDREIRHGRRARASRPLAGAHRADPDLSRVLRPDPARFSRSARGRAALGDLRSRADGQPGRDAGPAPAGRLQGSRPDLGRYVASPQPPHGRHDGRPHRHGAAFDRRPRTRRSSTTSTPAES